MYVVWLGSDLLRGYHDPQEKTLDVLSSRGASEGSAAELGGEVAISFDDEGVFCHLGVDLSAGNGVIEYQQWFFNDDGDDAMVVELSNDDGATWTVVSTVTYTGDQSVWHGVKIIVGNHLTPTSQMRIRLSVADNPNNSITEAAIDDFRVTLLSCD